MATGNSKFPGLNEKYVMEIEQRTANVPAGAKEILQQKMYSDFYAQQKREEEQAERLAMKNQIAQKQLDPNADNKGSMLQLKKGNLADVIRNYYKLNIADGDDDAIVEKFTNGIKDGDKMYIDYLNGDNNDIMVKTGLFGDKWKQLNAQQYVTPGSNVSNTVTQAQNQQKPANLTSTSHFDDAEYAKYYLDNTDKEYQAFVNAAREAGYEDRKIASLVDASKTYQDFLQRGFGDKAEEVNVGTFQGFVNFFGNAYNNLAGNNPYVGVAPKLNMQSIQFKDDLLGAGNNYGDLRASSGWTKGGEIFGDLLANTAVMMLLPGLGGETKMESVAESALNNGTKGVLRNLTQRGIYGAAEGAEFGALATMGQENADLNKLSTNMIAGGGLGSVFGVAGGGLNAYKYRNILRTSLKEGDKANTVKNLLDMYDRGVKPTSRGMKTNTQLQQYNDDTLGAVETIIKNKDGLKYIDVNGEETFGHLPRNLDEFSQAIKQTKQSIYNDYTAIAREAGKETSVDTSNIVKDLKSQLKNKEGTAGWDEGTKARIEKWIKDLEELDNKMSVEGTQNKIQELNQKIQTFIKNGNPNDVGTNAVDSWVLNGLKSSLDDAIENAGLDSDTYFALRNAYKQLKAIESDVNHRAIVYGRQNPESLVDSLANLSSIDAIAKFLKNPKEGALKFAGSQLEKISAKNRNNPNNLIKKMFNEADDTISKSDTLKTQAQLAGERTEKQAYNIKKNRAQRLQERQEAYNSKEQARQALLEKQQQQEAAYQEYLRSKGVGSDTNALPGKRSEYNSIVNDNTPVAIDPSGNPVRGYKEIQEIPQQSRYSNEEIGSRFKPDKDSQDALNDFLAILPKYEQKGGNYTLERLLNNMDNYNSAKVEYDGFLDKMASEVNGTALKPPLKIANSKGEINGKGVARALQKANKKSDGVEGVTDIVRGTTAVKDEAGMQTVKEWIHKNGIDTDPNFKFDDKFSNPTNLGYKDMSFIYTTKNGVKAEVQINTPNMMAAKEGEEAIKMGIISEPEYNALIKKVGEEGGKGHKYYEEWRKLNDGIAEGSIKGEERVAAEARMAEIEKESTAYYQKFEKAGGFEEVGQGGTSIPTSPIKNSGNGKIPEYNGIAQEIIDNGGITLDVLKKRNLGGEPYVAVSPYPNRSKIIKVNDFNDEAVAEYFEANADKLFEDGYALGGWVNDGNVYLDVSIALPKEMQNEAVNIANKYNQKAIFDLQTFEDIPTAGNGEFMDVDEAEISKYIKSLFNKSK